MAAPITAILLEDQLLAGDDIKPDKEKPVADAADAAADATPDADLNERRIYVEYLRPREEEECGAPSAAAVKPNRLRLPHIPSIPNFRALLWDRQRNPVVFRSARQECIAYEDINTFMAFDIKTIVDLRSCQEYASTSGERLLDRIYPVFEVSLPKNGADFQATEAKTVQVSYNYPDEDNAIPRQFLSTEDASTTRRRLLIPICNKHFLMKLAKEVGGYHVTFVRAMADLATFFKFGFLTRHFVNHFNDAGQWRLYVSYLECGASAVVAALKIINEPDNLPILFNCHMGKDRTGVLAAILLALVGVAREDILKDFSRSEEGIQLVRDEIREYMTSQRMFWDEEFLHAFPDDLTKTLEFVDDKYGSLNNLLHLNGFTFDEQARLKDNLLAGSRTSTGSGGVYFKNASGNARGSGSGIGGDGEDAPNAVNQSQSSA